MVRVKRKGKEGREKMRLQEGDMEREGELKEESQSKIKMQNKKNK